MFQLASTDCFFPSPSEAAQDEPWEEGRRGLWLRLRFGSWDARALLLVLSSVSMRLRANHVTCFPKCFVILTQCTMSPHPVTESPDWYQTNDFHCFYINFSKWPHPCFEGKTFREGNDLASYGMLGSHSGEGASSRAWGLIPRVKSQTALGPNPPHPWDMGDCYCAFRAVFTRECSCGSPWFRYSSSSCHVGSYGEPSPWAEHSQKLVGLSLISHWWGQVTSGNKIILESLIPELPGVGVSSDLGHSKGSQEREIVESLLQ